MTTSCSHCCVAQADYDVLLKMRIWLGKKVLKKEGIASETSVIAFSLSYGRKEDFWQKQRRTAEPLRAPVLRPVAAEEMRLLTERKKKPSSGKETGFLSQDPGDISGVAAAREVGGGWLSSGFKMKPHPSWPRRSGGLPVPEPFEKVDETFLNAQRGLVVGFFVLGGYWAGAF